MMLLVNTPPGTQELIEVFIGGGYFDSDLVIWNTLDVAAGGDGPLPEITLGGMIKDGGRLIFSQERMDQHNQALASLAKPQDRHFVLTDLLLEKRLITQQEADAVKGK